MIRKLLFLAAIIFFLGYYSVSAKGESPSGNEQINEFSLSGFGDRGKKAWDISAKSADILADTVNLKTVVGNFYGEKEQVKLTADKGNFLKNEGKVHLEDNVIITTASGAEFKTSSLDWDRKEKTITTNDRVDITKNNMITVAQGAVAESGLSKVKLQKDITVEITPEKKTDNDSTGKTIITCDGPLDIDYERNIANFNKNVIVERPDMKIMSDTMEVHFVKSSGGKSSGNPGETLSDISNKINRIIARGNVKIIRGENTSFSNEAVYDAVSKKITLSGQPKLVINSTEKIDASSRN